MNQPLPNQELLSAYLDNEVTPAERALVEQWLASDADYAATLAAWREQRESMKSLASDKIDVRDRVLAATQAASTRKPLALKEQTPPASAANRSAGSRGNRTPIVAIVGTLAALILVGVFLVIPPPDTTTSVAETDISEVEPKADEPFKYESPPVESDQVRADAAEELTDSLLAAQEAQSAMGNEADAVSAGQAGSSLAAVATGEQARQAFQSRSATARPPASTSAQASPPQPNLRSRLKYQASAPSLSQSKQMRKSDVQAAITSGISSNQSFAEVESNANQQNIAQTDGAPSATASSFGQNFPTWLLQPKPTVKSNLTIDQFITTLLKVKIVVKRSINVQQGNADLPAAYANESADPTTTFAQLIGQATPQQMDQLRRLLAPTTALRRVGSRAGEQETDEAAQTAENGVAEARARVNAPSKPLAAATAARGPQTQRFLFVIEANDEAASPQVPAAR